MTPIEDLINKLMPAQADLSNYGRALLKDLIDARSAQYHRDMANRK
jgi:hypothetical protein